jgi:hypothetical protein
MNHFTSAERVKRRRDKMRAEGLRPVQIWVPDTRSPGALEEIRRQCRAIAARDNTPEAQEEWAFWEAATADTWDLP